MLLIVCGITTGGFAYQAWLDELHSGAHGDLTAAFPNAIKGVPGAVPAPSNTVNITRAKETFGWTPIPMEKCL